MENTNNELLTELNQLKEKYLALEAKYNEEINDLRKREDEQLMRIMFLEGVANSTIDGFLVVNPYGQKILQNQRTVDLWKIPKEVVDDPDGLKQVAHVMNMTKNPQQFVAEIDNLREHPNDISHDELELVDGTILDRYSSPVIGKNGENFGRIWSFHDITERKNFEKQLSQLNADKDRFISILAHDLRSPFASLLGFAELLKKNLRTYQTEKVEGMVEHIYKTALCVNELLEDTLLWARVQKVSFIPSTVNLYHVISEVLIIFETSSLEKRIGIAVTADNNLIVYTDVFMLKAILRNLIANAIKFTNYQGKIEINAFHSDSFTTIKISDNGIGINAEALDKLFNSSSTKTTKGTANETGTGLGLMLCKEFVDKHGGKIWVESAVNKGTTVSFTLPDKKE